MDGSSHSSPPPRRVLPAMAQPGINSERWHRAVGTGMGEEGKDHLWGIGVFGIAGGGHKEGTRGHKEDTTGIRMGCGEDTVWMQRGCGRDVVGTQQGHNGDMDGTRWR